MFIPTITSKTRGKDSAFDVISHEFINNRTVYLTGTVDQENAVSISSQLRALDGLSSKDITMVINSPGGEVPSGFMIIDAMKNCRSEIITVVTGMAASMAAVIACCGSRGKRYITENAEIMIHQPLGGVSGQATEISIMCDHILKSRDNIARIIADNSGRTKEQVLEEISRDNYMDPGQALEYGIVDHIGYPETARRNEE